MGPEYSALVQSWSADRNAHGHRSGNFAKKKSAVPGFYQLVKWALQKVRREIRTKGSKEGFEQKEAKEAKGIAIVGQVALDSGNFIPCRSPRETGPEAKVTEGRKRDLNRR